MAATAIETPLPFVGYSRPASGKLTVFEIHGAATPAGVVSLFRQFMASPTPCLLWDLRGCSLAEFQTSDLQWMVRQLVQLDNLGERPLIGRSAFVCSRESDAIVMRRLIMYADAKDYGIELALFRDIDVARCWLAEA
jgi:hypothetical protein